VNSLYPDPNVKQKPLLFFSLQMHH